MKRETAANNPAIFIFRILAPIISLLPVLYFLLVHIFYIPLGINEIQFVVMIILSTALAAFGLHYRSVKLKALSRLSFFMSIISIVTMVLFALSDMDTSKNFIFSANLALISISLFYYHALDSKHKTWRSKFAIVKAILCALVFIYLIFVMANVNGAEVVEHTIRGFFESLVWFISAASIAILAILIIGLCAKDKFSMLGDLMNCLFILCAHCFFCLSISLSFSYTGFEIPNMVSQNITSLLWYSLLSVLLCIFPLIFVRCKGYRIASE